MASLAACCKSFTPKQLANERFPFPMPSRQSCRTIHVHPQYYRKIRGHKNANEARNLTPQCLACCPSACPCAALHSPPPRSVTRLLSWPPRLTFPDISAENSQEHNGVALDSLGAGKETRHRLLSDKVLMLPIRILVSIKT
jgi:hypothetical protein